MVTTQQLHCKIDERAFSVTMFFCRLIAGAVLLYQTIGCFLYYREFLYNATALGVPYPVVTGISVLVLEITCALMVILGWFTRLSSLLCVIVTAAVGWIFFASELNKIYVVLIVLLISTLLPSVCLGPGRISLDFKHAQKRAQQIFRS
jgi:uncharacterized membrane protein YphA (DoxX/SURF4 family)